jgi:hypothetical protein
MSWRDLLFGLALMMLLIALAAISMAERFRSSGGTDRLWATAIICLAGVTLIATLTLHLF